jgi:adenylate kinase family enzyme
MRVAIIGSSGSGKSTLARRLGARLDAPVIELDAINWQAGWRDLATHDPALFRQRIEAAIAGDRWIVDGNYSRFAREPILARATDLVWLDYPRGLIMRRVITRSILRAVSRRELWPGTGNRERVRDWFDKEHPIRWAWDTYRSGVRDREALFERLSRTRVGLHRLRTPSDADGLVDRLAGVTGYSAACLGV